MQKIYTAQTLFEVINIKNLLEIANISCEFRNQYAAGGVGELAFIDAWPELWVTDGDVALAKQFIEDQRRGSGAGWRCSCGELNGQAFSSCWACQKDKPL